jgi:hypothetical protein
MDGLRQAPGQGCARSAVPKLVGEGFRVVRAAYEWNRSSFANSALSAIETVKCFNGQAFELEQYKPVVMQAAKYYMKQALSNSLQIGFVRFITTAMFVQGFWYGSHLVRQDICGRCAHYLLGLPYGHQSNRGYSATYDSARKMTSCRGCHGNHP